MIGSLAEASDSATRRTILRMVSDGLVAEKHDPVAKRYTYALIGKGRAAFGESERQVIEEQRQQAEAKRREREAAAPTSRTPTTRRRSTRARAVADMRAAGDPQVAEKLRHAAGQRIADMRAAGLKPKGPYPGPTRPWPYECLLCGHHSTILYRSVLAGSRCKSCGGDPEVHRQREEAARLKQERRDARVRARAEQDASRWIRAWRRRLKADRRMRAAGWEPLETYSGQRRAPWIARCRTCGTITNVQYNSVSSNGSRRCDHCRAMKAEERMFAAGWEPLEDYPGSVEPWRCRHQVCGAIAEVRLNLVTRGWEKCPHCP
ncbi:hypothetical protein [Streptomyces pseudogriseolus]|uniref:hypothetical protein n=1 Tax=Streptomyces pseudogriseolus TaxID=36817 RepID=UPI003FA2686D